MRRQAGLAWIGAALLAAFVVAVLVYAGGFEGDAVNEAEDLTGYGGPHSDEPFGSRTLFHSEARIGGRRNGESYGAYNERRSRGANNDFFGFACPGPCTQHRAGYRWAVAHDVRKAEQCDGPDWAFVEGCVAFAVSEGS